MSFMYAYPFTRAIKEKNDAFVNVLMMSTNHDKQYKAENIRYTDKEIILLFICRNLRKVEKNYFLMYVLLQE